MKNKELITDEIVAKFAEAYQSSAGNVELALHAVVDDITRPVFNISNGWKRDAQAYKEALQGIRTTVEEWVIFK